MRAGAGVHGRVECLSQNAFSRRFFRRNGNARSERRRHYSGRTPGPSPRRVLFHDGGVGDGKHGTPVVVAAFGRAASEMIVDLEFSTTIVLSTHRNYTSGRPASDPSSTGQMGSTAMAGDPGGMRAGPDWESFHDAGPSSV
jgi:hypothetical protein